MENKILTKEQREAAFKEEIQRTKKEHEEKEAKKNNSGTYTEYDRLEYFGLVSKEEVPLRIIGLPLSVRMAPTDPIIIFFSKILNDNMSSMSHIRWKKDKSGKELDKDWILFRLYNDIMEIKWLEEKDDKGKSKFLRINEDSDVYYRVHNNKTKQNTSKYSDGFYPSKRIVFNAIPRKPEYYKWCLDNKHTMLFGSDYTDNGLDESTGERSFYASMGVSYSNVYERIINDVVQYRGHWDLDLAIMSRAVKDGGYVIKDALDDKIDPEVKALMTVNPLTDEEGTFELYNLDKVTEHTSYAKLKKNLGDLFKDWDSYKKRNFYDELIELERKEAENRDESEPEKIFIINETYKNYYEFSKAVQRSQPIEAKTPIKTEEKSNIDIKTSEQSVPASEPAQRRRTAETPVESSQKAEMTVETLKTVFPYIDNLNPDEITCLLNSVESIKDGVPVYKASLTPDSFLPCTEDSCKFVGTNVTSSYPVDVASRCPVCNTKFA